MKRRSILVLVVVLLGGSFAGAQTFTSFRARTIRGGPYQIASGPDGSLWFTFGEYYIGRITVDGSITEFRLPNLPKPIPIGIAAGPDGNLWFTEQGSNKIGRITTVGVITEFPLPPPSRGPALITAGADGNMWFTEVVGGAIGRITPTGTITEFPRPSPDSESWGITPGPDGNIWYTAGDSIGKITPAGVITEFPIPNSSPFAYIATGADGALWFTETAGNKIRRMTTSGEVTEFPIPTLGSGPQGIVAGNDGRLYFAESNSGKIGRITTGGVITEFPVPVSYFEGLAVGPDGAIWAALYQDGAIGRLSIEPFQCRPDARTLCLQEGRFLATVDWRVPPQNRAGQGTAVALTGDTGYFWFFDSGNVELVVKALDGRPINGHFWVFYGALSGVEYTIRIVDTQTGVLKSYFNPSGTLASVADTTAFGGAPGTPGSVVISTTAASVAQVETRTTEELYALLTEGTPKTRAQVAPCTPGSTTLCLNHGRFQLEVDWRVPSQGRSGSGMAVPVTGDTGYFWFFGEENVEVIIKVLDGRSVNGHFWVFYGALSNVEYTITVTDAETGAVKTYENPAGTLASHADTGAF